MSQSNDVRKRLAKILDKWGVNSDLEYGLPQDILSLLEQSNREAVEEVEKELEELKTLLASIVYQEGGEYTVTSKTIREYPHEKIETYDTYYGIKIRLAELQHPEGRE